MARLKDYSQEHEQVLNILAKYVPKKEFGIRSAYYKVGKNLSLDFLFIIDEEKVGIASGYIRSLFSSLEDDFKGLEINVSISIYEKSKQPAVRRIVKERQYLNAVLVPCFA